MAFKNKVKVKRRFFILFMVLKHNLQTKSDLKSDKVVLPT